jgi:hypothetical protein
MGHKVSFLRLASRDKWALADMVAMVQAQKARCGVLCRKQVRRSCGTRGTLSVHR